MLFRSGVLENLIQQLEQGKSLADEQVHHAVTALASDAVPAELKAAFLTALATKGETTEEIAAFARELRAKSVLVPLDAETRQRGRVGGARRAH